MGSPTVVECAGSRLNFTNTQTLTGPGRLLGVLVAQNSGGTLKVADSIGNIANTFTPVPGNYIPMPCVYSGTLTFTVTGSIDATAFYEV